MESTIKRIKAVIKKIKHDCTELKKRDLLTERGEGQLDVIKIILDELQK